MAASEGGRRGSGRRSGGRPRHACRCLEHAQALAGRFAREAGVARALTAKKDSALAWRKGSAAIDLTW
jgi:hypothetical protein